MINLEQIKEAHKNISPYINRTPLLQSNYLSKNSDEDKIAEGIKLNFEKHKLVTEGAAATGVMVVKDNLSSHLGTNIISLICGGNIDSELFGKIVS